jgi:hypothetical protein
MNFKFTKMYFPLKLVIHKAPNVDVDELLYNLFVGLLPQKNPMTLIILFIKNYDHIN